MNSQLPQEMTEAIIDHLHDDKPSLKACSLVCTAWTHPTRLHLFSRLTLKWPLQSAVFPFVRHLCIRLNERLSYGAPTWDKLIPLLVGFHRIVSLNLPVFWESLDVMNPETWSLLGKNFSGVVSLSLVTVHFSYTNVSSLARIICAFPCLRELSIRVDINSTFPELSSAATTFRLSPDLDTLELEIENVAAVLEWLLSLPVRPTLRTVRLYNLQDADLAIFQKFIRVFGNDLESLSLSTLTEDCALSHLI
jgi:hypothetical protein